ncbi:outer membrane protein assembly factor BamE [Acinetobacter rathckeae]|uniref:outer membrane protein assembly factor BamE n=1 Tax=Acinetobacter rathckeae TaxID=2605272 RepID=UPI0018A32D7D|nr:outer membrane protein assembly factor BamE [Acinetobacter rathckeae]MBF7688595.1 outer membrane protein assembly factor BamE [Acinetobacter rathckeae]MBF7695842.1 outer membrane protein assembly factor BamE [Acinetobacter rathckeae]
MQKIILTTLLVSSMLGGCVYKIDIPQGTPLTKTLASQVQPGMTYQQVRFLLGSPTIADPLNPLRWDYIYNYIPGTYAKKAKIAEAKGQHLKIYFNNSGVVSRIEGLDSIPNTQPGLPAAKETL